MRKRDKRNVRAIHLDGQCYVLDRRGRPVIPLSTLVPTPRRSVAPPEFTDVQWDSSNPDRAAERPPIALLSESPADASEPFQFPSECEYQSDSPFDFP
jgi:hypothetical protein